MLFRKKCLNCEHEFSTYTSTSKFCCSYCYFKYTYGEHSTVDKNRTLVKVQCAECNKIEYVRPSRAKKYVCCSVECIGKYNKKRFSQKVQLICPICGEIYECKQSKIKNHRTCGKSICRKKWLNVSRQGNNNPNYVTEEDVLKKMATSAMDRYDNDKIYRHIVKHALGLKSSSEIPKGYVIHHKDANHFNNELSNLVVLPKTVHRLLHTRFGNILLRSLHTGLLDRDTFIKMCLPEEWDFYKHIIDLNVTHQAVVKQGELLENPEEDNQQVSIYRNINETSTTNGRVLTDNAEDSNSDTSALLSDNRDDDIV